MDNFDYQWQISNTKIVFTILSVSTLFAVHYVYGIRFRFTNLSQQATISKKSSPANEILLSSSPLKYKILSQNIWCVFGKGGPQRRKRLLILINSIKIDNPDIICLQEMHLLGLGIFILCGDYIYIRHELNKIGYKYHTNPKQSTPYFGSSSGLVTFSKYPIIEQESFVFMNRKIGRCKGWLYTHISLTNDFELMIINTHLEHRNKRMQSAQIREISCSNIWNDNDETYKLCMGDFNICSNFTYGGDSYNTLCEEMTILGLNTDLYNNTQRTYCKKYHRIGTASLDHCFVDDRIKKFVKKCQLVDSRDDERIASDHLGLLTTIEFKN